MKKKQHTKKPADIFILTDACLWEKNKQEGTRSDHAIEVVNDKTGQTHYIKTGARIRVVRGEITQALNQELYNIQQADTDIETIHDRMVKRIRNRTLDELAMRAKSRQKFFRGGAMIADKSLEEIIEDMKAGRRKKIEVKQKTTV